MSALHLIKTTPQERLTIDELLTLLGPDKFTEIEARARIMHETFACPHIVPDYEGFKDTLVSFYALYQKTFFNADIPTNNLEYWRNFAFDFAQQHLTEYNPALKERHARDLRAHERNSITGRHGGMINVIDTFTDAIIRLHNESHIRSVFFERISPSDYDTRLRLADELIKKYGTFLFPNEELFPHYFFGHEPR
jgi:hypothetical protein